MNNKTKNKLNFFRPGYIIPVVYSIISGIIMLLVYMVSKDPYTFSENISVLIMQAGMVSVVLSPSALIVCGSLSMKHRNKFPLEPFYYSELPLVLSFTVLGIQVLYLVAMAS